MRLYIYGCKHPRTVCLVRKYTPTNTPKGVFANSLYPYHQQIQLVLVCKMVRIAIPTVEIRNIISENYVESGTINRPLRLRNQRGKIQQRTPPCGLFLHKCIATNTPQGVGADSSRPFFNPNQMVLMYRNDANCNAILWNYVGVVQ